MSLVGTFGTFTTARLGIYAAQKGLAVVGNNIANINTTGYTRQVLDQVSLSTGGSDLYRSQFDAKVGTGVLIRSINQIRDPYLDIRFRTEMASVGYMDKKLSGLNDIAAILDEVGKGENKGDGLLYAQLQKLAESLRSLGSSAGTQSNDTLAKADAENLATLFNTYADKLSVLHKNTVTGFKQDLAAVNETLINIRDLNDSIRNSELYGDRALELRDERNRLIDELSKYMKIDVIYTEEDIGAGKTVEKLTIRLANANPDPKVQTDSATLVDGIYATQLELPETVPQINPKYDPKLVDANNPDTEIHGFQYLKADGTGTNDIADANQVANDNFNLSLSKLLDINGREWIDSRTTKVEITPNKPGVNAVYSMTIAANNFAAGDKITLGSQTFTVGKDIPVENANKPEEMAKFLAEKLNGRQNKDYVITANGATLVLTAKKPGATVDDPGDPNDPDNPGQKHQGPEPPKEITEAIITLGKRTDPTLTFRNPQLTTPGSDTTAAIYTMAFSNSKNWQNGDKFEINGQAFTIGDGADISAADANDDAKMGEFLAGKLSSADYAVAYNNGNLVFTAAAAGANPAAPAKPANAAVTQAQRQTPTLTIGDATVTTPGVNAELPDATQPPNTDEVTYYVTQQQIDGKWYNVTTAVYHTQPVDLDDNDLYGSLQATRELLTESGEFASSGTINGIDENAAIKRGIPYYQKSLDLLAQQIAKQYNSLNNGHMIDENGNYLTKTGKLDEKGNPIYEKLPELTTTYYVDADGNYLGVGADAAAKPGAVETTATLNKNMTDNEKKAFDDSFKAGDLKPNGQTYDSTTAYLDANGVKPDNAGNLFSIQGDTNDAEGITAANISVSLGWSKGDTHIVTTYIKPFGSVQNTTQNENVSHMITMIDKSLVYNPQDLDPDAASTHLFSGSFNDMMDKTCSVLGNDRRSTNVMLNTYYAAAVELDTGRDSVSGVDLNDEAMNMIQYQKAYSAACRLMTVIDESLDRLINNTGIAGR